MRWLWFASMLIAAPAWAEPVRIVAAEDVYATVAREIAGPDAEITSILHNPDQDPHSFEASASIAHEVAGAQIAEVNGADYDPWMDRLLAASPAPGRQEIDIAALLGRKPGDNPHLWFDPAAMPAFARALAADLDRADPAGQAGHAARLTAFLDTLKPVDDRIAALHQKYAGTPVTATEPIFGLLSQALGLSMRNDRFQIAIMNDTEPRASDIRAMETDLRQHRVRFLVYNKQASDKTAERMRQIAAEAHVPVVGVEETLPDGVTSYRAWVGRTLDAVEQALAPH